MQEKREYFSSKTLFHFYLHNIILRWNVVCVFFFWSSFNIHVFVQIGCRLDNYFPSSVCSILWTYNFHQMIFEVSNKWIILQKGIHKLDVYEDINKKEEKNSAHFFMGVKECPRSSQSHCGAYDFAWKEHRIKEVL